MNTYNGVAANFDPTTGYSVQEPVDGVDDVAAATVTASMSSDADAIEWFRKAVNAALTVKGWIVDGVGNAAGSLASGVIAKIVGGALQLDGATGDDNPILLTTRVPTLWSKWIAAVIGTFYGRIYVSTAGFAHVFNAAYDTTHTRWDTDDSSKPSVRIRFESGAANANAKVYFEYVASGNANFVEGTWTTIFSFALSTGILQATGDVVSTGGSLKGHRLVGNSSAPTATPDATGLGGTGTAAASGTDLSGILTLVSDGSGSASSRLCSVALTAAMPSGMHVTFSPNNDPAGNGAAAREIHWETPDTQHFELYSGSSNALPSGTYKWSYRVSS